MKKIMLLWLLLLGITLVNAQEIGARFGDISGGNVAVDAVFSTAKFSRVHADVSFGDGVGIDFLYDFFYKPFGNEAFDWYVGLGPYSFLGDPFQLGLVGEIGLEYHFQGIPIAIGGDWRPFFRIIDNTDFGWGGFGFNVRFVL
ncbi:MAG: outer membrane insertion C- signal [Candidatus Brocadia sp. WS118]|nr:MAG: outer membrane insertion C- signal [Candidatus Brocadia sp. WS118]